MPTATILIVDDEKNIRATLARALELEGYASSAAGTGREGLMLARRGTPDLVLLDVRLPDIDGLDVLARLREEEPALPVVMISGHGTIETAVQAIRLGAQDFLEKPLSAEKVLITVANGLRLADLARENASLREALAAGKAMLGSSPAMDRLREWIARTAPTHARVLVRGENGTGKELVAQALHEGSPRARCPFVKVNCAAIPAELIESELFGHEKGAFTGADRRRKGKFELAHRGTLFLDEIGDMRPDVQAKLLRVLQEGEVERVGGEHPVRVDVRVLAATNQDLERAMADGAFREDLFYRLNVVPVRTPALRERKEDVPVLARHFLARACAEHGLRQADVTTEALDVLAAYDFPGNVRELRNLCERLVILRGGQGPVDASALTHVLPELAGAAMVQTPGAGAGPLRDRVAAFEREVILGTLRENDGHMANTARELGLERSHLYKKMRALGVGRD